MDASDKGFLNISCYKYNSFKNCSELAWCLISCWFHILHQLKSVAGLFPLSVWRHLCAPLFRCQKKKHVLMEPGMMYRGGQIVFLSKMGT